MSTATTNPLFEAFEQALGETGHLDQVPDHERGCGTLDPDSTYLRSDVTAFSSADGDIPTFVTFEQPIPYREGHFRTFKRINGDEYLLNVTHSDYAPAGSLAADDVSAHIERAITDPAPETGTPGLTAMDSMDLLMHIGVSYYPKPEDFITEARTQGISKKIPVSGNQAPPLIRPFRTRLFLIHPRAIPTGKDSEGNELDIGDGDEQADWDDQEFIPGVVGYTYLTRTIHTADVDGGHPEWAEQYAEQDLLHTVEIGEFVPFDSDEHPIHDDENREEDVSDTEDESFEARRKAFEDSPLGFHELRRVCAQNDLLGDVTHPSTDDLLDALAESDIPKPKVTNGGGD